MKIHYFFVILFTTQIFNSTQVLQTERILENTTTQKKAPASPSQSRTASTDNDTTNLCNQDLMNAYGLTGQSTPIMVQHKYCPTVTKNCCTVDDQTLSMQLWTSENQYLVEKYYETYLYSLKYILGYSVEAIILAQEFKGKTGKCKDASDDLLSMNLNPTLTRDIYATYNKSQEEMGKLRKGFYCVLCDAKTQESLRDFYAITNVFYKDRVYLSKDFCRSLVEKTIRANYFTTFYLKRFAEDLSTLIDCKTGQNNKIVMDISYWTKQQVKNCYYFKDKYFFFFCEDYCQDFHIVKPTRTFDGDINEIKKFVEQIMANKKSVFQNANNNILMYMVTYEDDVLVQNYKDLQSVSKFFTATNKTDLAEFKTDITYFGGMNPWDSCETSEYPLIIASVLRNLVKLSIFVLILF